MAGTEAKPEPNCCGDCLASCPACARWCCTELSPRWLERLARRYPATASRFEAVPSCFTCSQAFIGPPEVRAARLAALKHAFLMRVLMASPVPARRPDKETRPAHAPRRATGTDRAWPRCNAAPGGPYDEEVCNRISPVCQACSRHLMAAAGQRSRALPFGSTLRQAAPGGRDGCRSAEAACRPRSRSRRQWAPARDTYGRRPSPAGQDHATRCGRETSPR